MPPWVNAGWFQAHGIEQRDTYYTDGSDFLKQVLYRTVTETSLPQLLHYEDRNSMSHSIESRVPFLIPSLAKFILTLPEEYLIPSDGTTKAVFRQAMRGIVPDVILDRTDKVGFPTPERSWLLSIRPYVEQVLRREAALDIHALDMRETRRQWEQMVGGSRPLDSRVWRWVNLILWVEKFSVTVA